MESSPFVSDYMDSLCKDHFLQRQYRKLDGGVLWSRNERNLDCTVTFQTHSILQRFMLHFDLLQLDCNDHLYVYDGAHATTPPKTIRSTDKAPSSKSHCGPSSCGLSFYFCNASFVRCCEDVIKGTFANYFPAVFIDGDVKITEALKKFQRDKADLSCRNTKQQVGALFTRSNFVTLKYVTDNWGTDANGFKLVITAVKDPTFISNRNFRVGFL
ncbi:unnamed protein product [Chilo suppressalis]|uniref:Uncharacterized protein n=1 Tax=Chilo suppressalis TaxID=168631 RepID=A0ABN8BA44_CHISP|nr:unnamed protein product [Chilo suppressalis]